MEYSFITVEGNIGSGKTTLAKMLAEHFHARVILEEFADNPFLPKFYAHPEQYAFPLELFFMAERYKQLKDVLHAKDIFGQVTVSDYLFTKSLLFAKTNLTEEEYQLYSRLFHIINPQLVQPELLIYLHAPVKKLQENIRKRNRPYEQDIGDDYLFRIQEAYMQYIRLHTHKTLIIDVSKGDFEHDSTLFEGILEALEQEYAPGPHYLTLG